MVNARWWMLDSDGGGVCMCVCASVSVSVSVWVWGVDVGLCVVCCVSHIPYSIQHARVLCVRVLCVVRACVCVCVCVSVSILNLLSTILYPSK